LSFYNSSEVAKGLKQESYGLVFGINTFLALFFQTILTLIVADSAGLALEPSDQVFLKKYFQKYFIISQMDFFSSRCMEATILCWVSCSFPWRHTMPDVERINAAEKMRTPCISFPRERNASFQ
jgi:hypothetical protein